MPLWQRIARESSQLEKISLFDVAKTASFLGRFRLFSGGFTAISMGTMLN
ncbi:hypothetical protein LguiA_027990 [Lonicera macranthoides]